MMNIQEFTCLVNARDNDISKTQEAIEFALAAAAFGHQSQVIFAEQGVIHLLEHLLVEKRWTKLISQLELFDLAPLWVCNQSLTHRQLSERLLKEYPIKTLDQQALLRQLRPPKHVRCF